MATCRVCNKDYYQASCPTCSDLYLQCIKEGRIPPQFTAAGVNFGFQDWCEIAAAAKKEARGVNATKASIKAAADRAADRRLQMLKLQEQARKNKLTRPLGELSKDVYPY